MNFEDIMTAKLIVLYTHSCESDAESPEKVAGIKKFFKKLLLFACDTGRFKIWTKNFTISKGIDQFLLWACGYQDGQTK